MAQPNTASSRPRFARRLTPTLGGFKAMSEKCTVYEENKMSNVSYLLTPAHPDPDFDVPIGAYIVPVGWILGFGKQARITGEARIETDLVAAHARWRQALKSADKYLQGSLGPLRVLIEYLERANSPLQGRITIEASELVGLNPAHDNFIRLLPEISDGALHAIEQGHRAEAVRELNRWFEIGSIKFAGNGTADKEWVMSASWLNGATPEERWAPMIVGELDIPGWREAITAAVQFVD